MPRPLSQNKKRNRREEDSDDEVQESQMLGTQAVLGTQLPADAADVDSSEVERLAADCVRMALFRESQKLPLRREDIVDVLKLNSSKGTKMYKLVFEKMKDLLGNVFGYEIVEAERSQWDDTTKRSMNTGAPSKVYIIKSLVPDRPRLESDSEKAMKGFLMTVLAFVQLSNGKISEPDLFKNLSDLGVDEGSQVPGIGETAGKLVRDIFVKQMYLARKKLKGEDFVYKFGPRARVETSAKDVYLYVCKELMGNEPDAAILTAIESDAKQADESVEMTQTQAA
eukprot:GFYU01018470.1.p1 GENE.GFYU01018470.1~~GFYU01018470.1.p1  ORF type:complete len:282 (-),score=73.96 GFYU01018470.1:26-871(-)